MTLDSKAIEHYIALGFLGVAAIAFIIKNEYINAAWALGLLGGYAFKNGVYNKVKG